MAAILHIVRKEPSLAEFLAEQLTQATNGSWTCEESCSARLLDYVESFLKHSRAVDVEVLPDVLGLQFKELQPQRQGRKSRNNVT